MQDEIITENADSVENTANTEEVAPVPETTSEVASNSSNMSAEDFISSRLGDQKSPTDEVKEESEVEEQAVSETKDESETNVLSQVDLDGMSETDLRELSEKLGSRAVKRFGELTARRKQAEESIGLI